MQKKTDSFDRMHPQVSIYTHTKNKHRQSKTFFYSILFYTQVTNSFETTHSNDIKQKFSILRRVGRGFEGRSVVKQQQCWVEISDWLVWIQNKKLRESHSSCFLLQSFRNKKGSWSVGCSTQFGNGVVKLLSSAIRSDFGGFRWFYIFNNTYFTSLALFLCGQCGFPSRQIKLQC